MKRHTFHVFNVKTWHARFSSLYLQAFFMYSRLYAVVRMLVSYTTNSKIFAVNSSNLLIKPNNNGR